MGTIVKNYSSPFKIKTVINTIKKLVNVPIKYFSAKFLSSICLKRAILFAVKTKPISPNWLFNKRIAIIVLSSFPIIFPAFNSSE